MDKTLGVLLTGVCYLKQIMKEVSLRNSKQQLPKTGFAERRVVNLTALPIQAGDSTLHVTSKRNSKDLSCGSMFS